MPFLTKYFPRLFAVWALLLAFFTAYAIFLAYHTGPYRDMWIAMDFIRGWFSGDASLLDSFLLHGGAHRLAVPKLLFLAEYGIFHGSNLFLLSVAFLIQSSLVYLVWQWVRDETSLTSESRCLLVALSLVLMFNATQLENFLYTFDVQWFITVAAAAWALRCWILSCVMDASQHTWRMVFAVAGCVWALVSLFSSFSGVCVWLLLPVLMGVYQRRWLSFVLAASLVVVILVSYTRGPFGGTTEWIGIQGEVTVDSVVHFVIALAVLLFKWIALYLGSPLGREYPALAAAFVLSSFIFLGFQSIRLLRLGPAGFSSFQIWCLFIALFAAAVGFVTGWGRMHFVNTADEDRYQSVAALYWLGIFSLAYLRTSFFRGPVLAAIFFWTCLVIPYAAVKDARAQINFFDRVNTTNLAIATGQWEHHAIKSTLILGDQWKRINRPALHAGFLREKRWGIFATDEAQQLGQTFNAPGVARNDCEGQILSVAPVGDIYRGYQLTGQAYDVQHQQLFKKLLLLNDHHQIVGLARLQREKDSFLPIAWQSRDSAQWIGYTVDLPEATALEVWGEREDGSYCLAAKTATIPVP